MVINTEMQNFSENIAQNFGHMETMSTQFYFLRQSWTKYFEQTSILKKSLFSSLPLSNNVENVDKIHAGLAQLQHC